MSKDQYDDLRQAVQRLDDKGYVARLDEWRGLSDGIAPSGYRNSGGTASPYQYSRGYYEWEAYYGGAVSSPPNPDPMRYDGYTGGGTAIK